VIYNQNLAGVCREMYVAIDPQSEKPKEYANSAEFFKEVEEFTAREPEKPREVKNFKDASERIRAELGLDLRSPAEIKEADDREDIEQRIAAGVAEALERQQAAQQAAQAQAGKATKLSQFAFNIAHSAQPKYKFFDSQEGCGCKASQKPAAKEVIHTRRGTGPVMTAQKI